MDPRVNILLGTYNGDRFLRQQLESIENQTLAPFRITIRDDGSTDGTRSLIEGCALSAKVRLLLGPRLGVTENFFTLLANADKDSDFFAFCDQDDVWLPGKIERAITRLASHQDQVPVMYCSRLEFVDEHLNHLGYSRIPRRIGFPNALVENIATGCTIVLNRPARDLICRAFPRAALLHDWWCYLVLSALGSVVFDEIPTIKYRQHSKNRVGGSVSVLVSLDRRVKRLVQQESGARLLIDQATEFYDCFGNFLNDRNRATLHRFLAIRDGFWTRIAYSARMDVWRQAWFDNAILRAMILCGRV